MSPIPSLDYKSALSGTCDSQCGETTRARNGEKIFCALPRRFPSARAYRCFPLSEANRALNALKNDAIPGAAVLRSGRRIFGAPRCNLLLSQADKTTISYDRSVDSCRTREINLGKFRRKKIMLSGVSGLPRPHNLEGRRCQINIAAMEIPVL